MKKIAKDISIILINLAVVGFFVFSIIMMTTGKLGYRGEYRDLYTVAVNNVFGIYGYESNGEITYDPKIHIVETDSYGRTLFFYSEFYDDDRNNEINYGMAFVIMQSSDDDYAYYYRDKCYFPYFDRTDDWETISTKVTPDDLEALKEANDWNREINEERCAKAKITNKKPESKLKPKDDSFDKIIYPYMVENGYTGIDRSICRFSRYCETDVFDRELFYVRGATANPGMDGETVREDYAFAVILNADGTCPENGIIEIPTLTDSAATISKLKQDTNWNVSN